MRNDYYVYCYTNRKNGKRYVGKGQGGRMYAHLTPNASAFARIVEIDGAENFEIKKLVDGLTDDEACAQERVYIEKFKTNTRIHGDEFGYNQSAGGESGYRPDGVGRQRNTLTPDQVKEALFEYATDMTVSQINTVMKSCILKLEKLNLNREERVKRPKFNVCDSVKEAAECMKAGGG